MFGRRLELDCVRRTFLELYQKCADAEGVNRMQETIMEEGEKEWEERRKLKEDNEQGEDLLVRNPNHIHEDEEPEPPDSDIEEEDEGSTNDERPQR
jgi:hypothetical protein